MQEKIEEILESYQGILHGHFLLTSGLHSDTYFQCAKLYQHPAVVEELGKRIAAKLADLEFDTVISPAIGAIIIGHEVAKHCKKRFLFVERSEGVLQLRRSYTLEKAERIVIVEDVITTAKTIHETLAALNEFSPQHIATASIVDRTQGKTDFKIHALMQATVAAYEQANCPLCAQGLTLVKPGSREAKKNV